MDTERKSLLVPLTSRSNDVCITQFYPAWSLHALLRFCDFSYECSNNDINTSLGNLFISSKLL